MSGTTQTSTQRALLERATTRQTAKEVADAAAVPTPSRTTLAAMADDALEWWREAKAGDSEHEDDSEDVDEALESEAEPQNIVEEQELKAKSHFAAKYFHAFVHGARMLRAERELAEERALLRASVPKTPASTKRSASKTKPAPPRAAVSAEQQRKHADCNALKALLSLHGIEELMKPLASAGVSCLEAVLDYDSSKQLRDELERGGKDPVPIHLVNRLMKAVKPTRGAAAKAMKARTTADSASSRWVGNGMGLGW